MKVLHLLLIGLLLLGSVNCFAQKRKKVKLKQPAGLLKTGRTKDGEPFQRLIRDVVFEHQSTTIYCDSAHFYKKRNSIEAYGNVRIEDGDSVTITASRLDYDGNVKKAQLRNNVVFTKLATATLYTDYLDYSRPTGLAYYYNGGRLVDSINVLTSSKGYYHVNSNIASFKRNVKVTNPDYTMSADSMRYNSRTKLIYFVSRTTVINKDSSTFVYEGGTYNTQEKTTDISRGTGESEQYTIEGLRYDLDGRRNIMKVRGDVALKHKTENLIIYGQAADHFKDLGITKIYNNAYVAKITDDNDTLFMSADTLVSIDHKDPAKRRLLAYHQIKIFKKDLQGIADSLEYRPSDSTLYFYKDPILWTSGNQMTADSISMLIKNNTINKIFMIMNSFVISQDTLKNFNQIKGRKMTAEFANQKINQVFVNGNGESLYFILDDKTLALTGMNKIICSNIIIRFKDGRVNNLSFLVKPDANFIPPHELKSEDKILKGFEWKGELKPMRDDVVKPQSSSLKKKTDETKKAVQ